MIPGFQASGTHPRLRTTTIKGYTHTFCNYTLKEWPFIMAAVQTDILPITHPSAFPVSSFLKVSAPTDSFSPRPHSTLVQATIILCPTSWQSLSALSSQFFIQVTVQQPSSSCYVTGDWSSTQAPTISSGLTEHKSQNPSHDPSSPSMLASCPPSSQFIHIGSSHRLGCSFPAPDSPERLLLRYPFTELPTPPPRVSLLPSFHYPPYYTSNFILIFMVTHQTAGHHRDRDVLSFIHSCLAHNKNTIHI